MNEGLTVQVDAGEMIMDILARLLADQMGEPEPLKYRRIDTQDEETA